MCKICKSIKFIILVLLVGAAYKPLFAENNGREILNQNQPAIVSIWSMEKIYYKYNTDYSYRFIIDTFMLSGTGFFISEDGLIASNLHVVDYLDSIIVKTSDSSFYTATIVNADIGSDIVILKLLNTEGKIFQKVILGNSDNVKPGEECFAIGNPYGFEYTISKGIISGIRTTQEVKYYENENKYFEKVIQTDAAIAPGNSGGVLINTEGKIIGINTYTDGGGGYGNLNFAIAINTLIKLIDTPTSDSILINISRRRNKNLFEKNSYVTDMLVIQLDKNHLLPLNYYDIYSKDSSYSNLDSLNKIYKLYLNPILYRNLELNPDSTITYEYLIRYLILINDLDGIKVIVDKLNNDSIENSAIKYLVFDLLFEEAKELNKENKGHSHNSATASSTNDQSRTIEDSKNDKDISEFYYNLCLSLDSVNEKVKENLFEIYVKNDNIEKASNLLVELGSNTYEQKNDFIKKIAIHCLSSDKYKLVIKLIDKFIDPGKRDFEIKSILAFCYLNLFQVDKAENIYLNILDVNKDYAYIYLKLGEINFAKKDFKKAEKYLLTFLELSNKYHYRYSHSWDETQFSEVYKKLLDIAIDKQNKNDVILYLNILNGFEYKISQNDILKIMGILKGI